MKFWHWMIILVPGIIIASKLVLCEFWPEYEYDYFSILSNQDVIPVNNVLYKEECGDCHFAYQPGLLPAAAWKKIMRRLDDHYGDNAELDKLSQMTIENYLLNNAADRVSAKRSTGFASLSGGAEQSLRITDSAYFKYKHGEIPQRLVKDNADVGSFSNCIACHRHADDGSFDEHQVNIPGAGYWDD